MFAHPYDTLVFAWSRNATRQGTLADWQFDPISFAIGVAVSLLLVGLAYRNRTRFEQLRDQTQAKTKQLRERLTANMATRYGENAVETAQTMHLLGALTSLEKIYVETRLRAPLALDPDTGKAPTFSPLQALEASDRLVIIGPAGSGRTAMLGHLLHYQASQILSVGESARAPVYVYLPVLANDATEALETDALEATDDTSAQRLVRNALSSMSRVVATGVARWLRRQVEDGNVLVLLDGWDEVPITERPVLTAWIQELSDTCSGSRIIVTAGERGYGPLIEAGFVPLRTVPWTHRQLSDLTRNWVTAWPSKSGDAEKPPPSIPYRLSPPTPLEATLELAIQLRGQTPAGTPAEKMAQVMALLVPQPQKDKQGNAAWPLQTAYQALGQLAFTAWEQGRLTLARDEIQSAVTQAMPAPEFALDKDQEEDATKAEIKATREEQDRRTLQIVDCCRDLTASGAPIRSWDSRRFFFTHPIIAAYLVAWHSATANASITAHATDPAWLDVLRFYAGIASAEPLIQRLLSTPDDLFLNHQWTAAALLAASPPDQAPWRMGLIKRLAQLLMNPRLPMLFRERCLTALINSGEASVGLLFKKTSGNPDPQLRAGAILGLGAMGREQDIPTIETALGDESPGVRLAAINALSVLARMGNEQALELVVASIIESEDKVQRAAVETLAQLGPEGKAVLRDGAQDSDLMIRRATVYGLAATGENWAVETLKQMQQDDEQWLVRNAAAEALADLGMTDDQEMQPIDLSPPQAETEPWLIEWAAERGEGTGVGDAALATLMRALVEGDTPTRHLAIGTLRRLADPRTVDALRQALRDPEPSVRQAALTTLEEISRCYNMTIKTG